MAKKQNVLFITCDQLRMDSLGLYGNDVVKTPHIDELFNKGIIFDNLFTNFPVCAPNRSMLATGRWHTVNGLVFNGYELPHDETTMMDIFRGNGYTTYGVGKMHFTPQWDFDMDADSGRGAINPQPTEFPHYGFDYCQITEDSRYGPYADYLAEHGYDTWADLHSFSPGMQCATVPSPYPEKHAQTTWITNRAIDYIAGNGDEKPFFMWLSYVHPHHPFNPPEPWASMYDPKDMPLPIYLEGEHDYRSKRFHDFWTGKIGGHEKSDLKSFPPERWQKIKAYYYGMISMIDHNIGRVIHQLKEVGEFENTIFVFTTDHGELLGDHHLLYKSYGYDSVTRMPLMIRRPSDEQQRRLPMLCQSLDVMPTVLETGKIKEPDGLNGESLYSWLDGDKKIKHDHVLIRRGNYHSIQTLDFRLTIYTNGDAAELYDLKKDPDELNNVFTKDEYVEKKNELISKLVLELSDCYDKKFKKIALC